jgi:hypothetical protein
MLTSVHTHLARWVHPRPTARRAATAPVASATTAAGHADGPPAPAAAPTAPAPRPRRPRPWPRSHHAAPPLPYGRALAERLADGRRDPQAERDLLRHYATQGFGDALGDLRTAHPAVLLAVADAAYAAGSAYEASALMGRAHAQATDKAWIPQELWRRIGAASGVGDDPRLAMLLGAYLSTEPADFGRCQSACELASSTDANLARRWYLYTRGLADRQGASAAMPALSGRLLNRLLRHPDVLQQSAAPALVQLLEVPDARPLVMLANVVRSLGRPDFAASLEARARVRQTS